MESHLGPLCGAETQIDGEGTLHGGVGGRGKSSTGLRELQVVLSLQEAEGASCSQPDAAGREARNASSWVKGGGNSPREK